MKFQEFRGLSAEAKNMEILRMLPRLTPLTKEFEKLKNSLNVAIDKVAILKYLLLKSVKNINYWKINGLEYEYGILCNKTRSVDDILDRQERI